MNTKITDDVIEDAEAADLFSKLTREGFTSDYIKALQRFAQLQRQREHTGEAVIQPGQSIDGMHYEYPCVDPSEESDAGVCPVLVPDGFKIVPDTTPPSPSRELLEKAIDACRKAKISDTGNKAVDAVHNGAVDDCVKYIRALLPQEPKEEGKS